MRKGGIILLAVLAGVIFTISMVFADHWLEKRMEAIGSRIIGAKVEFDSVDFSLLRSRLGWERLQVADPDNTWTNLIETGQSNFDLTLEPLFKKKFIIEDFEISGIRFNTDRKTDGALPPRKKFHTRRKPKIFEILEKRLREELSHLPLLSPDELVGRIDLEHLMESVSLQTPRRIQSLKEEYLRKYSEWDERVERLPGETERNELHHEFSSVQPSRIDSPQELQNNLELLESLQRRAENYLKEVVQFHADFRSSKADLEQIDATISAWIEDDYRSFLDRVGLPELSLLNVAKLLFGRKIIERVERAIRITGKIGFYMEKVRAVIPEKQLPPRRLGQNIDFVRERDIPRFWVKRLALSGETANRVQIRGTISDIVSQQRVIDRPTVIQIGGEREDGVRLDFTGVLDNRGQYPTQQFGLFLSNLALKGTVLTDFPLLNYPLLSGSASIGGDLLLAGADFRTEIEFVAQDVGFDLSSQPSDMDMSLYRLSRSLAQSIDEVRFTASIGQKGDDFTLSIRSNLDQTIMESVEKLLQDEFQKIRQEFEQKIQREVDGALDELKGLVQEREKLLEDEIVSIEHLFGEQLILFVKERSMVESIMASGEERVDDELEKQKERLEEEVREKLKSLF